MQRITLDSEISYIVTEKELNEIRADERRKVLHEQRALDVNLQISAEELRADERAKTIDEIKQRLLKHSKTVREIGDGDVYDAVKIEWIKDLKAGEQK